MLKKGLVGYVLLRRAVLLLTLGVGLPIQGLYTAWQVVQKAQAGAYAGRMDHFQGEAGAAGLAILIGAGTWYWVVKTVRQQEREIAKAAQRSAAGLCARCGAKPNPGARFCGKCGTSLVAAKPA